MGLFQPEHENVLRTFYGQDHESYASLLESLSAFLEVEVAPKSPSFDTVGGGIGEIRKKLFDQGLCRIPLEAPDGMSLPFGVYTLAMELVAAADAPTAMSMGIHAAVAEGIRRFGSASLSESAFADPISGKKLAAFSLTEPASGSDARSMSTRAVRVGSSYVINGSKTFITNAGEADVYLVFARTEKGHSAFLVDSSTPGLSVGEDMSKLGMRGSRTAEVRFEDLTVPEESLVGEDGKGFDYVKAMLNSSRIIMGSICVGIARTAYGKALDYSAQRELFKQKLSDMQITREKVANMRMDITSGRLLCLYASRLKELDLDYASEAAQAKVVSSEMAARVCDQVIQIFGGYGYTNGEVHRHWRDARLLTIGEGTSEVLRMLIAAREVARSR
ncbi:MAG: acyl-CoA dehydrogenase family protein [Nitrososphaerales archaeon]